MEDHCSLLNWPCYQDERIGELRHHLLHTAELETAIVSAKEEIARREIKISHLKNRLSRTVKERNEAQIQYQFEAVDSFLAPLETPPHKPKGKLQSTENEVACMYTYT